LQQWGLILIDKLRNKQALHSISFSQILSDDDEGDPTLHIFVQQFLQLVSTKNDI